ncbi:putative Xaa-Pro aminopeptidase P [Collybia nuda]|uniref:Xaa-Pro aminopeptidase P n=1 Tax=Collybia nuda TaxID=64659 RepID=A0A9P6CA10_9AGAR|nr:putative Xaa-Pro aminopeptidase P [Collybia nuda]
MFRVKVAQGVLRRSIQSLFFTTSRKSVSTMSASGAQTINTTERLAGIRELMTKKEYAVQALVVPSEDQHSSEYLAHCDQRRAFVSGFTGSAGCAVVTLEEAFLFTDGRYFLQAGQQLDQNWTLMKQGLPDVPTWQDFLAKNLGPSTKIGIDATLISASDAETINKALSPKGSTLVPLEKNLVDAVWNDRPPRPHNPVFHLDEKYSGQSPSDKISRLREEMEKKKHKAVVVTMLDEVAWLFNLRGSDIDYNPVFFAYAVITTEHAEFFIENSQLDGAAREYLSNIVNIRPYDGIFDYLKKLPGQLNLTEESKILLGDKASLAVAEAIGQGNFTIDRSPVAELKAIKNATELEGFRQCHIRDGAALARYFSWLEEQLENKVDISESQGADKLEAFRSELDLFKGLSFDTISSTGPNGAIIHYKPDPEDCAIIRKDQVYLCDSGAQFLDGTTDTTRTWHFGNPTDEEKRAFTRVLQGHICIDTAIFPSGTTGEWAHVSDAFARKSLWQDGLGNVAFCWHGTGHGVGHFLNVHEAYNNTTLKAGMTVSNEPGYYADGRFGIRIENIVLVRDANTPNNFGDKGYLGFEHVTMCPIQKKLIDTSLLTEPERTWLNEYHAETWSKVSPLLQNDQRALQWLKRECSPL